MDVEALLPRNIDEVCCVVAADLAKATCWQVLTSPMPMVQGLAGDVLPELTYNIDKQIAQVISTAVITAHR
jgi:hypothetical protein